MRTNLVKNQLKEKKKSSFKRKNKLNFHIRIRKILNLKKFNVLVSKKYARFSITIRPNNFFFSYQNKIDNSKNRVINSEMLKIKVTKKRVKHSIFTFLNKVFPMFLSENFQEMSFVILELNTPIQLRHKLIKFIEKRGFLKKIKRKILVLSYKNTKSYNGCRAIKPKRVKRKSKHINYK